MEAPTRRSEKPHSGYNLQVADIKPNYQAASTACSFVQNQVPSSRLFQVPGYVVSQTSSSIQSQVEKQALNYVTNQLPSCGGISQVTSQIPGSAAAVHSQRSNPSRFKGSYSQQIFGYKGTNFETIDSVQHSKNYQSQNRGNNLQPVCREGFPKYCNVRPAFDDLAFPSRSNDIEGAQGFKANVNSVEFQKLLNSRGTGDYLPKDMGQNTLQNRKYIDSCLVQKVLDHQTNRRRSGTPTTHLDGKQRFQNSGKVTAAQFASQCQKVEHDLLEARLDNRMAGCRISDPDSASTGSHRDSGYQSAESYGDLTSDHADLSRTTHCQTASCMTQLGSAPSGTPSEQCEYFFERADNFMDLFSEQERLGHVDCALNFLNQAIDLFQKAASVPDATPENILRMRMKHNTAVLRRRRLMKQAGCSTETTARRLPCTAQEVKIRSSANALPLSHQAAKECNIQASVSFNRDQGKSRSQFCDQKAVVAFGRQSGSATSNQSNPKTGLEWTEDDVKEIKLYATLPKRDRSGRLATDDSTLEPVQNRLHLDSQVLLQNQESFFQGLNTAKNFTVYQDTIDCRNQATPRILYGSVGVVGSVAQRPKEAHPTPYYNHLQSHDLRSHDLRSQDVSTSTRSKEGQLQLVRL